MNAEYAVRGFIYDHTVKLQHGVPLVDYIDHEQCEPFETSPIIRATRLCLNCHFEAKPRNLFFLCG
jgi:hypothetical protein